MSMKSFAVHYKNKYPNGQVQFSETHLDAYDSKGVLRVSLRVGGGGVILDKGEELGAKDKHDLSPIPKNTRAVKLTKEGHFAADELHDERKEVQALIAHEGKIESIAELKKQGFDFDGQDNVIIKAKAE